jgi:proteasome lid subunit RPN8/RPN11
MTLTKSIISGALAGAIVDGVNECRHKFEERGGVIMEKFGDYTFVFLSNVHEDSPIAYGLYEASRDEFGSRVIPLMQQGWKLFASFHTHPKFTAHPSSLDLSKLFQGFKYNVIYSDLDTLCSFSEWVADTITTKYIELPTLLKLSL